MIKQHQTTASHSKTYIFTQRKLTEKLKKEIFTWVGKKIEEELIYPSNLMITFNISYEDSVNILDILEEANKLHKM